MLRGPNNLPRMDFRRRRPMAASIPTKTFHYTLSENWKPQPNKVRVAIEQENQNTFWTVKEMVEATHYEGYNGEIVVLGYNVSEPFNVFKKHFPNDKIICYQLEQIFNNQSWWFNSNATAGPVWNNTQHILGWLKGCDEIWDYDLDNIAFLESLGFKNVKFRPMQWFEGINKITHLREKDIDVLFYGGMNHKRSLLTSQLGKYNHKVLTNNFQAWGETLNEYIGRSKIILNLHFYDSHIQEQVRIFPLVANDCCVLSEKSRRNYFRNLIVEFREDGMIEMIDALLEKDNWAEQARGIGDKFKALHL